MARPSYSERAAIAGQRDKATRRMLARAVARFADRAAECADERRELEAAIVDHRLSRRPLRSLRSRAGEARQ